MIKIEANVAGLEAISGKLRAHSGGHPVLMRQHSGTMLHAVEENFAQEGRPKWLGLKPSTIASRVGARLGKKGKLKNGAMSILQGQRALASIQLLQQSGRLAASMTPFSDAMSAGVGTNVKYAAIQNFGGKTKPHVIRPKYKKALAFNGIVRKAANHPGSSIPARPFMLLVVEDEETILTDTQSYLASLF